MHDIDMQDRFHCHLCGQAYVVPSMARDCEDKDRAAAEGVEWLPKPIRVRRP